MDGKHGFSRRNFVGRVGVALGELGLRPDFDLFAQTRGQAAGAAPRARMTEDDYDRLAKLANNENPYGPPESVMKAMTGAFKYANRYGYPDGGIVEEIAKHHGVKPENIVLGAGSGEILDVVGLGVPATTARRSSASSRRTATSTRTSTSVKGGRDHAAAHGGLSARTFRRSSHATKKHYREVGFVYLCNPNNPTGRIVTKQEVKQLLDGIPEDVPVLIDEAYHHFVEDPNYATSVPYVLEGRPVIVARTFSKIAALAGMRLGYAIAPREIIAADAPVQHRNASTRS